MESAAVFLIGIAVVWLVFWIVRNDGVPTIRDQRGLYRMRTPETRPDAAREPAQSLKPGQGLPPATR